MDTLRGLKTGFSFMPGFKKREDKCVWESVVKNIFAEQPFKGFSFGVNNCLRMGAHEPIFWCLQWMNQSNRQSINWLIYPGLTLCSCLCLCLSGERVSRPWETTRKSRSSWRTWKPAWETAARKSSQVRVWREWSNMTKESRKERKEADRGEPETEEQGLF